MRISTFFVAALIFAGSALSSVSATLTSYVSKEGKVVVILNGEIAPGDTDQLEQIIKTANDSGKIVSGIRLNSLGGNLLEGAKLADAIRFAKIASIVPNGSTCCPYRKSNPNIVMV
jgi:membrane-bound ClpP family serine protease